jgi:two-component system, OmpR family, sensor histidine kinase KdpD
MVLCIMGISMKWGRAGALTGAIVGGIGYDYYFLGPLGFAITTTEYGFALAVFLITAIVTSQLVIHAKSRQLEAEAGKNEMEKLYRLGNVVLDSGGPEFTLAHLANQLVEIFGADGVALYDKHSGQIVRAGLGSGGISDRALHEAATNGPKRANLPWAFSLSPIRHGGDLVGSIGMSCASLSEAMRSAIATTVGLGLARLYAMEATTEAGAVRQSEGLKSAVQDAMAHEIRNPLNSIKLAATTLLSERGCDELLKRELLTIINEEVIRIDHLLDESMQIARGEATEVSLKREPQNVARMIPAAIEEMGALTGRRSIQVSVPESLPAAECDRAMVVGVLKQLLGNALKYSPEGSPLAVSAEFTGSAIVVDVVDCGPGVDDAERDRIFEKYYRGRAARSHTCGTGLGLASARLIMQAQGGEVWMTSPPRGGAAFHVSLPVKNGQPTARGGNH